MTDLRTIFVDMDSGADLALENFALATDDSLETAVILSLFTDARALDDDELPLGQTDRRGWWGDAYADERGDRFGSRLWLLSARKQLPSALVEAREIIEEALAWLVKDGLARRVEVETFIPRDEVLGAIVRIHRPDGSVQLIRFEQLWRP